MEKFPFLLIWLLILTISCPAQTVDKADSLELVKLYEATDGEHWLNNTGWLVTNVDSWYGVTLNDAGRVETIELNFNNLSGELPELHLSHLKYLYLYLNKLKGTIPTFKHTALEQLILGRNQLDSLPNLSLPTLNIITLEENKIHHLPVLDSLPNLEGIEIKDNPIQQTFPTFDKCPKIRYINFDRTGMYGTLPKFENCLDLQYFSISYNNFTGTLPDWSHLKQLTGLDLAGNQLTGKLDPILFAGWTELVNLQLYSNRFEGVMPLLNAPNLEELLINHNNFIGCYLDRQLLPRLKKFYIHGNKLNYDWLEQNTTHYINSLEGYAYAPQQCTPYFHQMEDTLYIMGAGGTMSNNTYTFYKDGNILTSLQGQNYIILTEYGTYGCEISNTQVPDMVLCANDWVVESFCQTEGECVLPGDANNNGSINIYDLPQIGRAYGNTGHARMNEETHAIVQFAPDWISNTLQLNDKYADCDGNGQIDSLDANVILQNYQPDLTNETLSPVEIEGVKISVGAPDTVIASSEYKYPLEFGSVVPFYAISFTVEVEVENEDVRINEPHLDLSQSFADDDGTYVLSLDTFRQITSTSYRWDISITRTNKININSAGQFCSLNCIIDIISIDKHTKSDFSVTIQLSNIQIADFEEIIQPIQATERRQLFVLSNKEVVGIPTIEQEKYTNFTIFPNPVESGESINVRCQDCPIMQPTTFYVYDLQGKQKHQFTWLSIDRTESKTFNLPNLSKGMYLLAFKDRNSNLKGTKFLIK